MRQADIRDLPMYTIPEAAHYLRIPISTLRDWTAAHRYYSNRPVLQTPRHDYIALSFNNLIEAYVLDAIRKQYGLTFTKVKNALKFLKEHYNSARPLLEHDLSTDTLDLFIMEEGRVVNVSSGGQTAFRAIISNYLKRIDRDPRGIPIKLYPFTRGNDLNQPKSVVIDPHISFGKPVLSKTGIPTSVVFERFSAGDSIDELAKDYGITVANVEEAIRCEKYAAAA